ncbi:MAG TPA: hypothetical protein VE131_14345, partial [Terriglobales bacterium]|nr:hypothetical protein [Terriglobales bacterium]
MDAHATNHRLHSPVKKTIVVFGIIGRIPLAGVAWQTLHYLEGFRRLGFDVYYIENTGAWAYDPDQNTVTNDPTYAVNFIGHVMAAYGFSDRWAYVSPGQNGRTIGLSESRVLRLFERADALINLTGSTVLQPEHLRVPIRIYLETDPDVPQIEIAKGDSFCLGLMSVHTHHFTYGENLGAPDCGVPVEHFRYQPTRQPIVMDWWTPTKLRSGCCFTTVANWRQSGKDVEWKGERYTWSKHYEFLKFIELPRHTAQPFELALALQSDNGGNHQTWAKLNREEAATIRQLAEYGWHTVNGMALSRQISPYREYISQSRGEFTVAKDQNVRLRSGWFSDRSACYLASGRPVITQDTAFGKFLPTGEGLFAFNTMEDILTALDAINTAYERHRRAAQ